MATLTSTACQTSASGFFLNPPRYIENGVVARSAQYTFGLAESAGDILQMIPIPKGAMVIDTQVQVNGHTGGNGTLQVGDGNSATRYSTNSYSVSAVGRMVQGLGYSYSAEDTIDVTFNAVTTGTAVGTIRLTVLYSFDNATDGNS